MELELNKEETEQIILEWANAKFAGMFNAIDISTYSGWKCCLTKETPKGTE